MGNFDRKLIKFWEIFIITKVISKFLKGLRIHLHCNFGTCDRNYHWYVNCYCQSDAKYKKLPRILNAICDFYVGLFRGTPVVVQLLVPIM